MSGKHRERMLLATLGEHHEREGRAQPAVETIKGPTSLVGGYVAAFSALLLVPVGIGCIQALGDIIPPWQLNLWRFTPQLLLSLPLLFCRGTAPCVARAAVPYVCVVCVGINILNWTIFASSRYLPAGTLTGIHSTIYLTVTAFVTVAIYRECPGYSVLAVMHCIAGSILIAQPGFIFGSSQQERGDVYRPLCTTEMNTRYAVNVTSVLNRDHAGKPYVLSEARQQSKGKPIPLNLTAADQPLDQRLGYVYITVSALIFTLVNFTMNKRLGDVDPFVTSSWVSLSGVSISLLGMLVLERPVFPGSIHCKVLLIGHAVAVGVGNVLHFTAMVVVPPLAYALIVSLRLPLLFCAQYTVLRSVSPGHRNAAEIVGAVLVFVGNLFGPSYRAMDKILRRKKHRSAFGQQYEICEQEDGD